MFADQPVKPIALRDPEESWRYAFGPNAERPSTPTLSKYRKKGYWPKQFYVGHKAFVLVADLERCIAQQVADGGLRRAAFEAQGRKGGTATQERRRHADAALAREEAAKAEAQP
jgi:hypothetical protein